MIVSTKSARSNVPMCAAGSPKHKAATLTHSRTTTDTLVLYEPCVRPSVVGRISRSSSLGRLCPSSTTDICLCVAKECIDKAIQTEEQKDAIYLAAAPEPAEQPQATLQGQSETRSPAMTSRSESRESARNPSPSSLSDSVPLSSRQMLAKRRSRVHEQFAVGGGTSSSGMTAAKSPRQMPILDWSSSVRRLREDQRFRLAIRKRALFVIDIDLAALLSFVIACALFVAVTSIAQQMFWPSSAASGSSDGNIIPSDRGYFEQNPYY